MIIDEIYCLLISFFLDYNKIDKKKQNFSEFDIVESQSKEMWLVSYVAYIYITAEVSLTQS